MTYVSSISDNPLREEGTACRYVANMQEIDQHYIPKNQER